MKHDDHRRTCWCGHRYGDHATGGLRCLAIVDDPDDVRRTDFCHCQRWAPEPASEAKRIELDADDLESIRLALRHFPTWFDQTAEKIEAMQAQAISTTAEQAEAAIRRLA